MAEPEFENRLQGPTGDWTNSLDLDVLGTLVRLGIITHTDTLARRNVRIRTFKPGSGLAYRVNADEGLAPSTTEQVTG